MLFTGSLSSLKGHENLLSVQVESFERQNEKAVHDDEEENLWMFEDPDGNDDSYLEEASPSVSPVEPEETPSVFHIDFLQLSDPDVALLKSVEVRNRTHVITLCGPKVTITQVHLCLSKQNDLSLRDCRRGMHCFRGLKGIRRALVILKESIMFAKRSLELN